MSIQTEITVRFETVCIRCDRKIEAGERAWWRVPRRRGHAARVTCETCYRGEPRRTRLPFEATIRGATETYKILVRADGIERLT